MATEDDGEGAGFLRQWNHKVHGRAAQRGPIEKPQPMHDGIAGAVGEAPFLMEHVEIALNIARRQGVRTALVIGGKVADCPEIGSLGGGDEPSYPGSRGCGRQERILPRCRSLIPGLVNTYGLTHDEMILPDAMDVQDGHIVHSEADKVVSL